jgi:cytochrome P450
VADSSETGDSAREPGIDLATLDDPRAATRKLRESPVVHIGDEFALITQRGDIESALRTPAVFSSGFSAVALGNVRPLIPLQIDPPKHVKYRRILDPLFVPRQISHLEPEVEQLADALIDGIASRSTCDLHEEFSVPLPCTVFLRLMGLPLEDLDLFLAMKDGIIRPDGDMMNAQHPKRRETATQIYDYFTAVIEERRRRPTDDLLGKIIACELDGEPVSDDEILDICFLFIIAGLDTVTDSLDCMFAYLAQNPEHRQQLVDDPALIPSAIEELLRWETPVPTIARIATEDTVVNGCPISQGTHVMLLLASANTDEEALPDMDIVDLARNPNPHLAFGGGVHRCLGSHLARLELRAALRQFHLRIPEYSLVPGTVLEYTPGLRALHHLPVQFAGS